MPAPPPLLALADRFALLAVMLVPVIFTVAEPVVDSTDSVLPSVTAFVAVASKVALEVRSMLIGELSAMLASRSRTVFALRLLLPRLLVTESVPVPSLRPTCKVGALTRESSAADTSSVPACASVVEPTSIALPAVYGWSATVPVPLTVPPISILFAARVTFEPPEILPADARRRAGAGSADKRAVGGDGDAHRTAGRLAYDLSPVVRGSVTTGQRQTTQADCDRPRPLIEEDARDVPLAGTAAFDGDRVR